MKLNAKALFEAELTRRGITYVRDDELTYRIEVDGIDVVANLANVARNADRDTDPLAIARYIDHVMAATRRSTPEWREASSLLFFSAEPSDQGVGDTIVSPVTADVARVLTLTDHEQSVLTFVSPKMCEAWGVTPAEASSTALANQNRLLDGVELELGQVDGNRLGMVPIDSPYKASVIFAPRFRQFVEQALGWPVLVVIPCRDFIYVVADKSPLISRLGSVVVKEFRDSGYPITTEVLRVSDDGIAGIGKYPV